MHRPFSLLQSPYQNFGGPISGMQSALFETRVRSWFLSCHEGMSVETVHFASLAGLGG